LVRAAENHIVETSRIERDPIDGAAHGDGGEIVGTNVSQRAARAANGRANGGHNQSIRHSLEDNRRGRRPFVEADLKRAFSERRTFSWRRTLRSASTEVF